MTSFRYASHAQYAFILMLATLLGTAEFAAAQSSHPGSDSNITSGWANLSAATASNAVTPSSAARGGAGSLDATFGDDGINVFPAPEHLGFALQSDGKIVTGGRLDGDAAVFRFNDDGSFDETFGTDGVAKVDLGGTLDVFQAVALQADGKIVAAGSIFLNENGDGDGAALARFNVDGTPDTGFGTDGVVFEPGTPESGTPDAFQDLAIRPTGEIVAVGPRGIWVVAAEANECYVAQYLPDGSRDTSFGEDGLVSAVPDADVFCLDGHLMDDGRYAVAVNVEPEPFMSRWGGVWILPDGTVDMDFGDGGLAALDEAVNLFHRAMTVSSDGSTTHGAFRPGQDAAMLVRFTPGGELDADFGDGGTSLLVEVGFADPKSFVLQPDGKIMMSGRNALESGAIVPFVARAEADGSVDASFGADGPGYTLLDTDSTTPSSHGFGWNLGLDAENRIVVTGNLDYLATPVTAFIARFENDVTPVVLPGGLDSSFGTDGVTMFESEAPIVAGVAFQPDGKILTGGRIDGDAAVFRFNADGTFDESFGTDGIATADLGGTLDTFLSLAVQDDGKIVAAGSIFLGDAPDGDGAALARFNADGTLDTSFGTDGVVLEPGTPESDTPDAFWHVAVRPTGEIVAAGSRGIIFVAVEANACYAAQYLPDGSRDTGFGEGGLVSTIPDEDVGCLDAELLDDGRYVVGVNVEAEPFMARWGAVRLLPDGSHDASYGEGGVFVLDEAAPLYSPSMIASPDGSTTHGSVSNDLATSLVRFSPDGTLDTSYGEGGFAVLDGLGLGTAVPWDLALQPDGKILMSGFDARDNNVRVPFLARAGADGTIDTSFGADGEGITYIDLSSSDTRLGNAYKLGLDDENRIVVSGIADRNASPIEAFVARFENDVTVSVEALATPEQLALAAPYPNPTHSTATLEFVLSEATDVRLTLYDILGREVAVVLEDSRGAGIHVATLDTSRLASGLYVARLTAGREAMTRRLTVVR